MTKWMKILQVLGLDLTHDLLEEKCIDDVSARLIKVLS